MAVKFRFSEIARRRIASTLEYYWSEQDRQDGVEYRQDAGETAAALRQLEFVYQTIYEIKYAELKVRRFLPIDTSVPGDVDFYTYRMWDMVGMAKIISDYADDLPSVESFMKEETARIKSLGLSYQYSIMDLRRSARTGSQLDMMRARAARRGHEQTFDDLMAFGNVAYGIQGWLTNPNVPIFVPTIGQWVTNSATPLQMYQDLADFAASIVLATKETFMPDTLLLDNISFERVNGTPMSTTGDSDKTVLRYFLDNNPYIRDVDQWNKLNAAGAGGVSRAVCYKRDPEVLSGVEPQPFEQLPPQEKNLAFNVPTHSRNGGVRIQYPLAVAFCDDLSG